jgi:hypothetical protein
MNANGKVTAATSGSALAGAFTIVLVYVLGQFKIIIPPEVASAITLIFGSAGGFLAGYFHTGATPTP